MRADNCFTTKTPLTQRVSSAVQLVMTFSSPPLEEARAQAEGKGAGVPGSSRTVRVGATSSAAAGSAPTLAPASQERQSADSSGLAAGRGMGAGSARKAEAGLEEPLLQEQVPGARHRLRGHLVRVPRLTQGLSGHNDCSPSPHPMRCDLP